MYYCLLTGSHTSLFNYTYDDIEYNIGGDVVYTSLTIIFLFWTSVKLVFVKQSPGDKATSLPKGQPKDFLGKTKISFLLVRCSTKLNTVVNQ